MSRLHVIVVLSLLAGCSQDSAAPERAAESIVVAVLPDQSQATLIARHTPLIEYLEDTTALDIDLVIPADYGDLVEQFDGGSIDLAWFGGLTFTQAEARSRADPLAIRDVDLMFTSCYLARSADSRTAIEEFENEDFSFGPRLSTSGHLMPRYFLEQEGIYAEQFFATTRHSPGHDQTAMWVSDGTVSLGVANCVIVQSLFDAGTLTRDDIRIVETTPPYPDYVWAVKASMNPLTRDLILDALLALDATDSRHREILRSQGANAYMPASRGNFVPIRKAAQMSGLLDDEDAM